MRLVLQWLKSRGLFFVDSQVTRLSVGPQVARQIGVPQTRRDVFIDNVLENDTIRQQLNKAAKLALKKGRAVVIGHAHRKTLEVIAEMIPNLEAQGIQLVDVKEMLES